MNCPQCQSDSVTERDFTETRVKKRNYLVWWLWALLVVFTCGIAFIFLFAVTDKRNKTKIYTDAVCNACGHKWRY